MDLSPHIWITIFDHLEHPERIALGQIYPLYHHRWAQWRAKQLLARTGYLSHHTLESLTHHLLRARFFIFESRLCPYSIEERLNSLIHPTATANQEAIEVVNDSFSPDCSLVPSVCPVLFFSDTYSSSLLILDEKMRLWINNQLVLEGVTQMSKRRLEDESIIHFLSYGQLFEYQDGSIYPCMSWSGGPISLLSDTYLVSQGKIHLLSCCDEQEWEPLEVGQRVTVMLSLSSNPGLFLIQDETGCYLLSSERNYLPCSIVQAVITGTGQTILELENNCLVLLNYQLFNDKISKIEPIWPKGRLLFCPLVYWEGKYSLLQYNYHSGYWFKARLEETVTERRMIGRQKSRLPGASHYTVQLTGLVISLVVE